MTYPIAIFLGAVQGVAEFLPVSSSGHLVLLQKLLGISEPPILFDILIHLGTLLAVTVFLYKELVSLFKKIIHNDFEGRKILFNTIVATLPAIVAGFLIEPYLSQIFNSFLVLGLAFFTTSAILFFSRFLIDRTRNVGELSFLSSFIVGLFQALAILPGVSRSGSTIVGGFSQKLNSEQAFNFSLYLAYPAIIGAVFLEGRKISSFNYLSESLIALLISSVVGFFALKLLKQVLVRGNFHYFSIYTLILGIISIFLYFTS